MDKPSIAAQPLTSGLASGSLVFIAFLCLLALLQNVAGCRTSAFGAFPDESAHFTAGVMVHDYLFPAPHGNPIAFAKAYYVKHPFFALGVWPPLFYGAEAVWMAVFGVSRAAALWLEAVLAAALATLAFLLFRLRFGTPAAWCGALLLFSVPVMQWNACLVMVDIPSSLVALLAVHRFSRYLDTLRWRDAILFACLMALAIYTKNSTYYIGLVPPLAILFGWRWSVLRQPSLWATPFIVGALYGPWLFLSRQVLLRGIASLQLPGLPGTTWEFLRQLVSEMGFLMVFALVGVSFLARRLPRVASFELCVLALPPALLFGLFVARVPVQQRLLVLAYFAVAWLVLEGVSGLARSVFHPQWAVPAAAVLVLAFGATHWLRFRYPPHNEIGPAVARIEQEDHAQRGSVLLPSTQEGPWIAEFAERESPRPYRLLVRPTKFLVSEDWNGGQTTPYYHSPDELARMLHDTPVRFCVLLQRGAGRVYDHDRELHSLLTAYPDRWRVIYTAPEPSATAFQVFENTQWTPAAERATEDAVRRRILGAFN